MSLRLLGFTDGRLRYGFRAVDKLLDLGFSDAEILRLLRERRRQVLATERATRARSADQDREVRRHTARWAIRRLLSLGFSESEIASHASLAPATVTHALAMRSRRAIGTEVVTRLKAVVERAGMERLRVFLQDVPLRVLDTCNAKGYAVGEDAREQLAGGARTLLHRALLQCSAPVSMVSGVRAFLVQIGDRRHGLYLLWAPSDDPANRQNRIEQLKHLEHEVGHVEARLREERIRLEGHNATTKSPRVGHVA